MRKMSSIPFLIANAEFGRCLFTLDDWRFPMAKSGVSVKRTALVLPALCA